MAFTSGAREARSLRPRRSTYPLALVLDAALLKWHSGETASADAAIEEAISQAKELNDCTIRRSTTYCGGSRSSGG